MKSAQDILLCLSQQGYKKTKLREMLVSLFEHLKKPLSALEIQAFLKKKKLLLNKTTIYRELQFLREQRVIVEIDFGDGKKRYEMAGLPHHHHLVCDKCRSVEDVFIEQDLMTVEKKIKQTTSFFVKRHSLEFFGLCKHCLN